VFSTVRGKKRKRLIPHFHHEGGGGGEKGGDLSVTSIFLTRRRVGGKREGGMEKQLPPRPYRRKEGRGKNAVVSG